MKNQTYRMTMLLDFYGEILTQRQREFFDLYYNEDLSLAEIAENYDISRQGLHHAHEGRHERRLARAREAAEDARRLRFVRGHEAGQQHSRPLLVGREGKAEGRLEGPVNLFALHGL